MLTKKLDQHTDPHVVRNYQEDILETSGGHPRANHRNYDSKILYPNGEILSRPLDMPPAIRQKLWFFLAAAVLIGAAFLFWYFDQTINEPKRQQQAIAESLKKEVPYNFPALTSLMPLDNSEINTTLSEEGIPLFEMPAKEGQPTYELIKLPEGLSIAEAGAMYITGISKLSASDAARLLNGAWTLQVNRENGVNMVLRFADFKSETVDAALQAAIAAEGLTESTIGESGTDNAGNTYVMGTVDANDHTYSWRVSALPLSKVYNIDGLPENAVYVGIRMTS